MALRHPVKVGKDRIYVCAQVLGFIGKNLFDQTPHMRGPLLWGDILFDTGTEQDGPHLVIGADGEKSKHTCHFSH